MRTESLFNLKDISKEEILTNKKNGLRLNVYTTLSGKKSYNYLPEPELRPTFLIVEKYRLSTFLGQYGAGRTIKTFSLLPGEKTHISISTYKRSDTTESKSSSVLDSYTEETADDFETSIAAEQASTVNEAKNFEYHAEAEAQASWGWGSANVSGGVSGGTDSSREEFAKNTSSATSKHASKASSQRNIEVNTNFESKVEEGVETSITRNIENINVGRTLNFTFRQMNQEFISLLHLIDVRIAFFNGYAESKDEVAISGIDGLMEKYVKPDKRNAVKETILNQIRRIRDYNDDMQDVIEFIEVDATTNNGYWRFKKKLMTKYTDNKSGSSFDVAGIIVSANKNVMRTDGVIVEALLGQANALDDYSKQLQEEKVISMKMKNEALKLENAKLTAALEILQNGDSAAAENYKTMFNSQQVKEATES